MITGVITINGVDVTVGIQIVNKEIILHVPEDTDLKNWYHAVHICSDQLEVR